jgi:hypothetical protein
MLLRNGLAPLCTKLLLFLLFVGGCLFMISITCFLRETVYRFLIVSYAFLFGDKNTKIGIKKAALGGFSARKYKLPHGNTKILF